MTREEKIEALEEIALEVRAFKGLEIARHATNAVPGEGDPDAEIMFIGEAPGFNEDKQGRPFVGQAGKLLEKSLQESLGMNRDDVYITNIVKYRPPDNRDPFPDEIEVCRDWLDRQIRVISPKIIATLGRFSMGKFIEGLTISRVHGQPRFVDFAGSRYIVYPMYHPAAALRAGSVLEQFRQDFNKLKALFTSASSPATAPDQSPSGPSQGSLF
ncbi:MAG: Phage SPO1 DNA polymerase-related protein [Candidatus Amesbacteria bacterium GW2011_GWA1_47_16]|uniref:Type-4 uracil-DNA glycosylase n=4 Tax=Candidatus Amesiibacteriota TaxID=1752730 RepID=A0A0G1S6Q4_9BACT|nr:MAG: Phage SPO1 DNA polymerase-related protein [Candidatus Amesbacteria bacterium GW2011_GWA1_47_16]KKU65154.1 MAG: Phage SPO1 DNA polymerase-related protein [Candidatus Amesbacteria bacterium GW2011_GWC1_47_15]KKU98486.1 MAG: Phage SPO1 DNA polymerase-related protein [Candidatus Amesbacteria bacterium GW2011_GWB1_48_13]OGD00299.1 MAG: hypothetical protein A2972_00630 [Candidatus Amesbacteria bacterium RIFCSPLOWO2_01_FULL_47_33]OGD00871.1 MAG: hypothetical protein A2701_00470 [Candidatus Ame